MNCQIDAEMLVGEEFSSTLYRKAICIGSVMYLMICTKRDVALAVDSLSQRMKHSTQNSWVCVKFVLQTQNKTADVGLVFDAS